MSAKSLVRNVADSEQVKKAGDKIDKKRWHELDDLSTVLATPAGRRLAWRVLGQCRVFESIWHASAEIHYKAGQQDIGHWFLAEITEAQPNAFIQMMQEAQKLEIENE